MKYCVGLDLGGTTVKVAIVDEEGQIVDSNEHPTLAESNNAEIIYKNISNGLTELLENHQKKEIVAIGIGSPGDISPEEGKISAGIANIPAFNGFPLGEEIQNEFNYPTFIDNDANNAARGEYMFGAAKGVPNFTMITLGTGIGGAIFLDGELYGGKSNTAGEVGHMLIVEDGKQCTCGNFGCWEAYGSATAMLKKTRALIERGFETSLAQFYPDNLNAKIVTEEAQKGDEIAIDIMMETGRYIGIGVANLINILNPEMIVIGGGVSQAGDVLLNQIKHYAKVNSRSVAWESVHIVLAELGNRAGMLGSAALAFMNSKKWGPDKND